MASRGSYKKQVSFADDVKQEPVKHLSDMNAFERISYVHSLDFSKEEEKEEEKEEQSANDDYEAGKLTRKMIKRYVKIHIRKLKYKLKLDPDRKQFDTYQTTLLVHEVNSLHPDVMRVVMCLERGADPNVTVDKSLRKPLHAVIRRGDARLVGYLLQAGADVNSVDARNQTPLARACDSQRVDRSYINMVEVLLAHPDASKGLEIRDSGSNTPLLNAIFRNNVWLTRLLLLKKAKVKAGKRNAYDVATFIMAEHIHLDIEKIPEFLLNPQESSCFYKAFSLRGRYHSWKDVFWQSLTNSDVELVFRMVKYRYEELEREQMAGRSPAETPEPEKPIVDASIGGSAAAKKVQRMERALRRKRIRQERKEKEEQERWEREKSAMAKRVDEEFTINIYRNSKQKWQHDREIDADGSTKWTAKLDSFGDSSVNDTAPNKENTSMTATIMPPRKAEYGRSSSLATDIDIVSGHTDEGAKRVNVIQHANSTSDLRASGKRWSVEYVDVDKKIYSDNPAPGTGIVSIRDGRPPARRSLPVRESKSAGHS